ncbi:MAG: prepilin-type N-terminal cleavage/methylation domain-containing protein [Alcaligenaceae bacterium]|nr:prepilin-type N-terminal cleavage/methylation domain-containing protein [Alcaligenaceae bacterium]
MRKNSSKKGFTLVELSLSIAFIAILSITIALIINDAISTYRRGLTLNQINTTGMDLVDDIRTAVQNSPASSPRNSCKNYKDDFQKNCEENNGMRLMNVAKTGNVNNIEGTPLYGAFCTGAYSYIWNSGYLFLENGGDKATYAVYEGDKKTEEWNDFRLLKVEDRQRAVCGSVLPDKYNNSEDIESEFKGKDKGPVVLLANDGANPLALYSFTSALPAVDGLNSAAFYSMSFILGTVQGGINVMSMGNFCAAPESFDSAENFDYCAINKFNFAAQANGRK